MDDALLFIDANRYLDIYRIPKEKRLLAMIKEQQEHIFITKQVVDEVERNKLTHSFREGNTIPGTVAGSMSSESWRSAGAILSREDKARRGCAPESIDREIDSSGQAQLTENP
jgi:hypothetical protein